MWCCVNARGGLGIVDGFVREYVDDLMLAARFRWVASGDPSMVALAVLEASGLVAHTRRETQTEKTGSDPDTSDIAREASRARLRDCAL